MHSLRSPRLSDLGPLEGILLASRPVFSDEECRIAMELIREGMEKPGDENAYQLLVAETENCVAGYACFGSIPLSQGAYDLYWIAVDPACRGRGIGGALLRRVEALVAGQGGRLIVAETAGRAEYDATRRFYEGMHYTIAGRIRDYYRPGDDKVTYVKHLTRPTEMEFEAPTLAHFSSVGNSNSLAAGLDFPSVHRASGKA